MVQGLSYSGKNETPKRTIDEFGRAKFRAWSKVLTSHMSRFVLAA